MVAPPNDNFANAILVEIVDGAPYISELVPQTDATTEGTGFVFGIDPNVEGASLTAPEPGESGSQQRSLWWKYYPGSNGLVSITTELSPTGGGFNDTQATLWRRRPGFYDHALEKIVGFPDGGPGYSSKLTDYPVTVGEPYYIQVGHWNTSGPNPGVILRVIGPDSKVLSLPFFVNGSAAENVVLNEQDVSSMYLGDIPVYSR